MFIDTHAHLQDEKLINDIEQIIARAEENNIQKIICVGTNINSSKSAIDLSKKFKQLYASIGIHPEDLGSECNFEKLEKLAEYEKVIAIGEIGLDYHFRRDNKEMQKNVFQKQIELAYKLKLPIIVHSRDCIGDVVEILENNKEKLNGGVLHCFNESKEILERLIKIGFYVSFGGVCTFSNVNHLIEIIKQTPMDRFLLETDCPYLAPVPFRGRLNEPKNIFYIAQKIADIKNVNIKVIEENSTNNAKKLFKI